MIETSDLIFPPHSTANEEGSMSQNLSVLNLIGPFPKAKR